MITLAEARAAKGLSQKELAQLLEVGNSTISMYEKGERDPSTKNFKKMAEILEVPMEQLVLKSR